MYREVIFELRLQRGGVRNNDIRRKGIPGGGHRTSKGPEVERGWACLRNIKEDAEAGTG